VRVGGLLAAASAAALLIVARASAQTYSLPDDAAAFGARESAEGVHISPDGRSVVYIAPAPKGGSLAFVANLETGDVKPFLNSGTGPEKLSWCSFITDQRLVCRYRAILDDTGQLVGFSRLIAVDRDGSHLEQLGQDESFYEAGLRQYDGDIIDWIAGAGRIGADGARLCPRNPSHRHPPRKVEVRLRCR